MRSLLFTLLSLCLAPALAHAQSAPTVDELRAPWLAQQKKADAMRQQAKGIRDEANNARAIRDAACYKKFLVNKCLDESREQYLATLSGARKLEADAYVIDTEARRQLNVINSAQLQSGPAVVPATSQSPQGVVQPRKAEPTAKPLDKNRPPPAAPRPTGTTPAQRAAEEARHQKADAERQQQAAERARKAQADRERYDKQLREVQEKKAKRANKLPGPNALPEGGADTPLPPPPPPGGNASTAPAAPPPPPPPPPAP